MTAGVHAATPSASGTEGRTEHALRLPDGQVLRLGPRTLVMGIVNVTPDSFSDGGSWPGPEAAIAHGLEMVACGADLLDVGGESTRPGASKVGTAEERERILPVIATLARRGGVPVSVDTSKPEVAAAALDAGAGIVNDTSCLRDGIELARLAADRGAPLLLMHSRGTPRTMPGLTRYPDGVAAGVRAELCAALARAQAAGLPHDRLLVDPGIGFAKTAEQSLAILRNLFDAVPGGLPVVVGVSRKSFIGSVLDRPVADRAVGTLAAEAAAVLGGAHVIRTHDAGACRQLADLLDAVRQAGAAS